MLTQRGVAPYLLERGLVGAESFVAGDLVVADVSRRNRNFTAVCEHAASFLLKQGVAEDGRSTVAHEALVYRHLQSVEARLARYLPRYVGYDADQLILIVELFRDARDLREYHNRQGRFPSAVAAALGTALALLHSADHAEGGAGGVTDGLATNPPWVLSLHRPQLATLQHLSIATLKAVKIIQRFPEYPELLEGIRAGWMTETLVHGDLRWDNCLVVGRPRARKVDLRIIDWELSGIGDACWDVGCVFSEYLAYWVSSIPVTGPTPPEGFVALARHPLESMHPAITAFWNAYAKTMGLRETASAERLLRSVRFAAVRLLQKVYESHYHSTQLTGNAVCLLQLGLNILRRPQEAAVQLLGVPLHTSS